MGNRVSVFLNRIRASAFAQKAGVVAFGTLLAQGILILSVPFLTRIYSVPQFGQMGYFMLVGMFGIQLLAWRFDYGIAGAESESKASRILALCLVIAGLSTLIFSGLLVLLLPHFKQKDGINIGDHLLPVLLYAYTGAIWNACTFYNIRLADYKLNAWFNILRAALTVLVSFLLQGQEINGLIAGLVTGQLVAGLLLLVITTRRISGSFWSRKSFSFSGLMTTARESSGFLKFSLPSAAIELFSGQLPQYFIGSFGATVFGLFSQANRLLNAPLDLLGQSIRTVFWETGSKLYRKNGNCLELFDKIMFRLAGLSLLPFILLFLLAPWLFAFVLGAGWEEAGHYARLLVPLCFFRFVSNPLSSMFFIAEKQRFDFAIQAMVLTVVILLYFYPGLGISNAKWAIMVYSAIYSCKYIAELIFSRQFAGGDNTSRN